MPEENIQGWEIKFDKLGYQGWDIVENVELIPHKFDIKLDTSPELVQGETIIYRPAGDAFIKFADNGNIEVSTSADVTITCKDEQGNPSGNVVVDCDIATVTAATSVTIDSPTITLDGNVTVTGNLQVDGVATLGSGGALIARQGDATTVTIPGGSSAGTYAGSITGGSPGGHTAS